MAAPESLDRQGRRGRNRVRKFWLGYAALTLAWLAIAIARFAVKGYSPRVLAELVSAVGAAVLAVAYRSGRVVPRVTIADGVIVVRNGWRPVRIPATSVTGVDLKSSRGAPPRHLPQIHWTDPNGTERRTSCTAFAVPEPEDERATDVAAQLMTEIRAARGD